MDGGFRDLDQGSVDIPDSVVIQWPVMDDVSRSGRAVDVDSVLNDWQWNDDRMKENEQEY